MLILILIVIAAFFNGCADMNMNMYQTSIFTTWGDFWNPTTSWKNQFKNGDRSQGPKFLGSTTVFVFLTSGWHLCKFLWLNCLLLAIFIYKPIFNIFLKRGILSLNPKILDFILLSMLWGIVFELTLKILKKR